MLIKYLTISWRHFPRIAIAALLFSAYFTNKALAQPSSFISGIVQGIDADGSKQLSGASVQWLGSVTGTLTGKDGRFNIKRSAGTTKLIARYVGYRPDTIEVATNTGDVVIKLKSVFETSAITVEGESAAISKVVAKTERISAHELGKSACCSLSESFEKNASAEVSYSDAVAGAKQIQLLGLRGIYTQILTEAVPSIRGLAVPYGADYFPGPWMESISISKGAASVASGYESITGQINVELKKAETSDPLYLNGYANDMKRYELNVIGAQKLSKHSAGAIMLHGRNFKSDVDQNADGFLDMPSFRQLNGLARWHFNDDKHELQVVARALNDRYDGGQTSFNPETDRGSLQRYGIGTRTQRYEAYIKAGLLEATHEPDISVALVLGGAWHDQLSFFGVRDYAGLQKSLYSKAVARITFDNDQYVMAGISWQGDNYNETFMDTTFRRVESVPGVFLEYTSDILPKLTAVAGVRADFHNLYGTAITPRVHLKYALTDYTSLRISAGSGFRTPNIIADNFSAFANSRRIFIEKDIQAEKAWNYGASFTTTFDVLDMPATFDVEFFRTDFLQQMVVDFDQSPREIHIGNLQGTSYANSALAQITITPAKGLDVMAAWRLTDTRTTTGGMLQMRPLMSVHRLLSTISYETSDWLFASTLMWNGGGRIPLTKDNPDGLRLQNSFDGYFRANAQISKKFGNFELYIGAENITNYIQPSPIIDAHNPFGQFFDASLVWGPLDARTIYGGFRLSFPRGE